MCAQDVTLRVELRSGASVVKIFDDIEERGSLELAMSVMGFESSASIVAAILTFAFLAVGTVLLVIYVLIAKEKRVATVRELRTDKMPELTLELGLAYHAFLSHVWSSGQDQCAVIKRQLRHLLPGIRVFLDVDDLTDISMLEAYIEHSASIVVFLSKVQARMPRCTPSAHHTFCSMLIVNSPLVRATSTRATACGR